MTTAYRFPNVFTVVFPTPRLTPPSHSAAFIAPRFISVCSIAKLTRVVICLHSMPNVNNDKETPAEQVVAQALATGVKRARSSQFQTPPSSPTRSPPASPNTIRHNANVFAHWINSVGTNRSPVQWWHMCVSPSSGSIPQRAALARVLLRARRGEFSQSTLPQTLRNASTDSLDVMSRNKDNLTPIQALANSWVSLSRPGRTKWRPILSCVLAHPDYNTCTRIRTFMNGDRDRRTGARRHQLALPADSDGAHTKDSSGSMNVDNGGGDQLCSSSALNTFEWLLWHREWSTLLTLWLRQRHNVSIGLSQRDFDAIGRFPASQQQGSATNKAAADSIDDGGDGAHDDESTLFSALIAFDRRATAERFAMLLYYAAATGSSPTSGAYRLAFASLCRAAAVAPGNLLLDVIDFDAVARTTTDGRANSLSPPSSPVRHANQRVRFHLVRSLLESGRIDCVRTIENEFLQRNERSAFVLHVRRAFQNESAAQMIRAGGAFATLDSAQFLYTVAPDMFAPTSVRDANIVFRALVSVGAHRHVIRAFLRHYEDRVVHALLGASSSTTCDGHFDRYNASSPTSSMVNGILAALLAFECPNTDTSLYLIDEIRRRVPVQEQLAVVDTSVVCDPRSAEKIGRVRDFTPRDTRLVHAIALYREWLDEAREQPGIHVVNRSFDVLGNNCKAALLISSGELPRTLSTPASSLRASQKHRMDEAASDDKHRRVC